MDSQPELPDREAGEKTFSKRRIKTLLIGALVAIVVGFVAVNAFTYLQYGSTLFGSRAPQSTAHGKIAYRKGTDIYLGVIKGEGRTPGKGAVYFIEGAGGTLFEMAKELVELREPTKQ